MIKEHKLVPRISVIVPVYNVKTYIHKCLDSIINQTFNDIEIILVDDGSTDGSELICDEYAKKEERIRIFHTENRGLSAARNMGIEKARGDWLMFVDSDDWVEPNFCMIPYQAALFYDADLVIFMPYIDEDGNTRTLNLIRDNISAGIVDAKIAVNNSGSYAWNKLYRKCLFDSIRYPEGKVYEDIAVTHRIVLKSNRVVLLFDTLYHYVSRPNSIGHTQSKKYREDGFIAAVQRYEELKENDCVEDLATLLFFTMGYLMHSEPNETPIYRKAESIMDSINSIPESLTRRKKAMIYIWKINKKLFFLMCKLNKKRMSSK